MCHPGRDGATGTALNVLNLIMLMRTAARPEATIIKIHAGDADDIQRRLDDVVIFLLKVICSKSSLLSRFGLLRDEWLSRCPWAMLLYLGPGMAPHVKPLFCILSACKCICLLLPSLPWYETQHSNWILSPHRFKCCSSLLSASVLSDFRTMLFERGPHTALALALSSTNYIAA